MGKIIRVETTAAVYRTLLNTHIKELCVYSSFSDPDGHAFGGGGQYGRMETRWGFKNFNAPLMEAETTFELEHYVVCGEFATRRVNEKSLYWLLFNETGDDDET